MSASQEEARAVLYEEAAALLDVMPEVLDELQYWHHAAGRQERWPLVRLGDRKPIPPYVRWAVFERDGGLCMSCNVPLTPKTAQLDHIIPWSAGGPDTSDNLRILCEPCNIDRSNFRGWLDIWGARRLPVAFWCSACLHRDSDGDEVAEPFPVTPEMPFAYCATCGLVSRTWTDACY